MSMLASFSAMINYGQLIIYLPSVERPGHLWGDSELEQGFAWSPGIVSLGVPEHAFICLVEVDVLDEFHISDEALSCLRVPFDMTESPVFIGSVFDYQSFEIETRFYSLIFEVLPGRGTWEIESNGEKERGDNSYVLKIHFLRTHDHSFEILKVGGAVHSKEVLSRLSELG